MPFGSAFFMSDSPFIDLISTMGKSEITAIVKFNQHFDSIVYLVWRPKICLSLKYSSFVGDIKAFRTANSLAERVVFILEIIQGINFLRISGTYCG